MSFFQEMAKKVRQEEGALPTLLTRPRAAQLLDANKPVQPHSQRSVDPEKATSAIAEAWKLSSKHNMDFDSAMVIVVGQQSAGKTSFVERYLGYAFSVVKHGMATTRPSVLTILPQEGREEVVEVIEELPDGSRSSQDIFTGKEALTQLHSWVTEKNTRVAKERLFITIHTQKCKTPRRVMDLPGVRASDEAESQGVNDAIIAMVSEAMRMPNSIVVCLADSSSEPANDNMVKLFRERGTGVRSFSARLVLVLTKADNWFAITGRAEVARSHLQSWKEGFYGIEPMLMGSSLDKNVDSKDVHVRNIEYERANDREEQNIAKFRHDVLGTLQGDERKFWEEKVGFKHVQFVVQQMSLKMDLSKMQEIKDKIQKRCNQVKLKLDKTRADRENSDPEKLQLSCSRLVSALLADTTKFLSRCPGACLAVHLSSSQDLEETAKTLFQEEDDFMQVMADFSPDAMQAAWNEQKMQNIDYSRAAEQSPDEFSAFHRGVLEDSNFLKQVPQCEDALLAGAAMSRAVEFFEHMALQYMYLDKNDVTRIQNAVTINPDMPFVDDDLQRIFVVGNIKAAKMRDITMYLVQKTAYLMTQGFACAFRNMRKNEMERDLIDSLAAGTSVDQVFNVLRAGFIKQLLVHAQHAYLSSISDHSQFMHQVGSFCRSDSRDSGEWLREALQNEVRRQLSPLLCQHKAVEEGVNAGLRVLGGLPMRRSLPVLVLQIVSDMMAKGIVRTQDVKLHHFLGMAAVAFGFFAPQFSTAVIMRCMSGLLGSLNSTYYRHAYEESVHKELTKVFIDCDLTKRVEALTHHEAELEEEYKDLCHALEKLRRLP